MKANKLFRLLEKHCNWCIDEDYEIDFRVRITQMSNDKTGELMPLYEIEADDGYGGFDTMYYWGNGHPTWLSQHAEVNLKKYNIRDREGILLTQKEYERIKKFID